MPSVVTLTTHGEERRQEILAQAIDVFGEVGYGGARIDEVARRVGIRRPSILYHFPDKRSLYEAAIGDVVRDIIDRVLMTENEPKERLEAITDAWIDFVIQRPSAARLLLRQMIDAEPDVIRAVDTPLQQVFASIQTAIDERSDSTGGKPMDAMEFSLVLSSTSLVWVASRNAVEGAFGLDTLSAASIQRHRRTLHALTQQVLAATRDVTEGTLAGSQRARTTRKKNRRVAEAGAKR